MTDLASLRYIVIDDAPTMRTWLRNSLLQMGAKSVDTASNYADALHRFANREEFDVVICDYVLDEEKAPSGRKIVRDGQHLLEELRHRKLISVGCVFLMVTAEAAYERVFAAAELAPDDYLLKPLTPVTLAERLDKAVTKKTTLRPLIELLEEEKYDPCLAECARALANRSRYRQDILRLIGDCLLGTGRNEQAHAHYTAVLAEFPTLPWARYGLARTFFSLDRYDESRELLQSLIVDHADYAKAHDLLAEVYEAKGDHDYAKKVIKDVLARNPRSITRHREIVRMSLDTDCVEDAVTAYSAMFDHGRGSVALAADDFSGFASTLLQTNAPDAAGRLGEMISLLNDQYLRLASGMQKSGDYMLAENIAQYCRAKAQGDAAQAAQFYRKVATQFRSSDNEHSNAMKMAVMDIAAAAGDSTLAGEIAETVLADYNGNDGMKTRIVSALDRFGMGEVGSRAAEQADRVVLDLNRKAVTLARKGDLEAAMQEFIELAEKTRNLSITFNAALAIVKWFDSGKKSKTLENKLRHFLDVIRNRDRDNPRTLNLLEISARHLGD